MSEQKNRFNYRGTLHEIGKVQTFSSGFKKCEIVCKTVSGEFTDYAVFIAKKELAEKAQLLSVGDEVEISFALDGHEWEGPKGKRWFGGATAFKVELASGTNAGSISAVKKTDVQPDNIDAVADDDIPF